MTLLAVAIVCGCSAEFPTDPVHLRAATAQSSPRQLKQSLESIKAWHRVHRTGLAAALRPGLSGKALEPTLLFGKCALSDELKTLWSWHDGEISQVPFVWYHDFLTLEHAIAEYRWLVLNPLVRWDPAYLPVLSFDGEWYGAYCGSDSATAGPIVHFDPEGGAHITATNLTTFMAMMAEAMEDGAVTWIDGGMVDTIGQLKAIHARHNPGLEFPYYVPHEG